MSSKINNINLNQKIMKKIVLFLALCTVGLISAASPSEKEIVKTCVENTEIVEQKISPITFQGFAAYDTSCCGTCFVYGTYTEWDFGNGIVFWEFKSASQATQATIVTPDCTGEGSYLG